MERPLSAPALRATGSAAPARRGRPRTLVDVFRDDRRRPRRRPGDRRRRRRPHLRRARRPGRDARPPSCTPTGVRPGDRVGVRIASGTAELYVAILAALVAGAAYVPVDADDPDERARLVFGEADVAVVLGDGAEVARRHAGAPAPACRGRRPPRDDAWVIFTSGSTGTPKGVAVSHRSAAAFVDAEARLFLQDAPLGPGDRVMAGLSVAFDASCEEMWLAWAHGACLVPAPRSLVRSGMDLGPWLVASGITVGLDGADARRRCGRPDALGRGPAADLRRRGVPARARPPGSPSAGREVWNTYGPTEATVVACAARLTGDGPGADRAAPGRLGPRGGRTRRRQPVAEGEVGELIIGGVGPGPLPRPGQGRREVRRRCRTLGWERAYRSGDLVRYEAEGLRLRRAAPTTRSSSAAGGSSSARWTRALLALPGVAGAAAAVRTHRPRGTRCWSATSSPSAGVRARPGRVPRAPARPLPAALVPRLAVVDDAADPRLGQGRPGRAAVAAGSGPTEADAAGAVTARAPQAGCAELWTRILGVAVAGPDDDFFDHGGGSLAAAQLVSLLRERYPGGHRRRRLRQPAPGRPGRRPRRVRARRSSRAAATVAPDARCAPRRSRACSPCPLRTLIGLRWLTWLGALGQRSRRRARRARLGCRPCRGGGCWLGWLLLDHPARPDGRRGRWRAAAAARRRARAATRAAAASTCGCGSPRRSPTAAGADNLAGAPWITYYARALGATVGRDVDLHSVPPVTGCSRSARGARSSPRST